MKQLLSLALALLPCLAWAQYPSNGNQKITLGEQTTADGLFFRGVAATDTVRKPSVDTMAYMLLDTTTNIMWHYKKATNNAWLRLNLLASDTASMLTNYYRSGRAGIIQALDVPTLNQSTTGSAATLTTSRTFQTNLASTSTASFNGSANVTPGITGTLPVANGGTGASVKIFVDTINAQTINGIKTFSSNLIINTSASTLLSLISSAASTFFAMQDNSGANIFFGSDEGDFLVQTPSSSYSTKFITKNNGNVGIGTTTPQSGYRLHVVDSVYVGGNVSAAAYTTRSDYNLKYDIFNLKYGLNDILKLQPVEYTYKSNGSKQLGFIAQDIGTILPEVVSFEESMSVNYQAIIPILTKAIQEQNQLIKQLEQRIINLENK